MRGWLVGWVALLGGCDLIFELRDPGEVPCSGTLVCPSAYGGAGPSQYLFQDIGRSWDDASNTCVADETEEAGITGHTHLVVIDDEAELQMIRAFVEPAALRDMWVGHTDRRVPNAFAPVTIQATRFPPDSGTPPWGVNEPTGGDCVSISRAPGNLLDADDCGKTANYLCECDCFADDPAQH